MYLFRDLGWWCLNLYVPCTIFTWFMIQYFVCICLKILTVVCFIDRDWSYIILMSSCCFSIGFRKHSNFKTFGGKIYYPVYSLVLFTFIWVLTFLTYSFEHPMLFSTSPFGYRDLGTDFFTLCIYWTRSLNCWIPLFLFTLFIFLPLLLLFSFSIWSFVSKLFYLSVFNKETTPSILSV